MVGDVRAKEASTAGARSKAAKRSKSPKQRPTVEVRHCEKHHRWELRTYCEIPSWLRNNHHIHTGYRCQISLPDCWLSLFSLHNETVNIWTHLLGFLFVLGLALHTLYAHWEDHFLSDQLVFLVYYVTALGCLASSTLYHLFHCHSPRACYNWSLVDYSAIGALVVGSCYPLLFYAFAHSGHWQITYITSITLLGLVGIFGPMFKTYNSREWKSVRCAVYAATALSGVVPALHTTLFEDFDSGIYWGIFWMYALYGTGLLLYITRFPECVWPGRFDVFFHSHQLWHVFVVAAIYVHAQNCIRAYQWYMASGVCTI